ncbi:MAG: alkaline phosphatase PhoX [Planctomycetota bacterium]
MLSRRNFLASGSSVAAGFLGLQALSRSNAALESKTAGGAGYGELKGDPAGVLDLPPGFSYRVISRAGQEMADGFVVPGLADGMAAFSDNESGLTTVVRNHEISPGTVQSAFGRNNDRLKKLKREQLYDFGAGKTPGPGGTTTIVYDTQQQKVVREYLSLAGTIRNCAGGPTPWGSCITCEETVVRKGFNATKNALLRAFGGGFTAERDHGFNFEVPASVEPHLADPIPLTAMGRFNHEAVAVDPASSIVYQTEDRGDGVIYRFIPNTREDGKAKLTDGGRLQALAIKGSPRRDTRNWDAKTPQIEVGGTFAVAWIDLDDVEAPQDDLRYRAFDAGAARFARGEGMWYGDGSIYFACTSGGRKEIGQIWKYTPSRHEGTDAEAASPGELELFIEPNDSKLVENADNLTVAPWNELFVCEDRGSKTARIIGVTPDGQPFLFAASRLKSELAGATFSPDGSTLFFNVQKPGLTIAVTGPWRA